MARNGIVTGGGTRIGRAVAARFAVDALRADLDANLLSADW